MFLQDNDQTLKSLKRYPNILKVFELENTPLASSGSVERLFSFAGIILTPNRQKLSDSNFEQLVLLKANKNFIDL